MNRLSTAERARIIGCLVEGMSIRATVRVTGFAKNTVVKLLADLGKACQEYQDKALVNLACKRIQCDEIWSFVYSKQKNVPDDLRGVFGVGDVWTWTAIDADTKLAVSWLVANRSPEAASVFMQDVAARVRSRVQITTDGLRTYVNAIDGAFGCDVDYAMLVKMYGNEGSNRDPSTRYSPGDCTGTEIVRISGKPDTKHISTSFVERQNLTMRMSMRRFTRLTNAFSKKVENLEAAVSLHFMYYNFARVHQTLRVTPAMEAKVTDHVWTLEEIADVLR